MKQKEKGPKLPAWNPYVEEWEAYERRVVKILELYYEKERGEEAEREKGKG